MVKVTGEIRNSIKVIVIISIVSFSTLSLGANEDEELLKQAKQIFGPLPQVILSE
jgi:hypothetical protein